MAKPIFGVMLALSVMQVCYLSPCYAATFFDTENDTFGMPDAAHDITSVETAFNDSSLVFTIGFAEPILPASAFSAGSVVGFIDLDLDQDAESGALSNVSRFLPEGSSGLGVEIFIDLFSERFDPGRLEVLDVLTQQPVGTATALYRDRELEVSVPLDLIGGDRLFDFGVIVGDFVDMSDAFVGRGVPEPGTALILLTACLSGLGQSRHRWRENVVVGK